VSSDQSTSPGPGSLNPEERQELERLRAEIAALRSGPPPEETGADATARPARGRRNTVAAVLVLILACLLAPVSVVAVWAKSQVFDTNRYVETVAPLANDPAVQAMVTTRITNEIFSRIDVEGLTSDAIGALQSRLPNDVGQNLQALSGVMANGIQNAVGDQIGNVVASNQFANAWAEANRAAHAQLVATLSGQSSALKVQGTTVSVQLAPFINAVKQRLTAQGFGLAQNIPTVNASFVILQSDNLPRLQRGFDLLNTLGLWLPFVTLFLLGLGVYLARDHRIALIGAGLGVAASMLLLGIGLAVARLAYLDAIPASVMPANAASDIFDTIVRFLREGLRAVGLGALVIAAGAFLLGSSRTATTVRQASASGAAAASRGLSSLGVRMLPVSQRVAPHTHAVRIGLVIVAFMAFLLPAYPTPTLVVWIAIGLLAALLVLQVLSSPGKPAGPAMPT